MATVERIVPIARVSNISVALEFYCSVLGFNEDFHYRAGPEGPDYVGLSLNRDLEQFRRRCECVEDP